VFFSCVSLVRWWFLPPRNPQFHSLEPVPKPAIFSASGHKMIKRSPFGWISSGLDVQRA
jgi:hypothetical protein